MAITRGNLPGLLKGYLFFGSFILIALTFLYTSSWIGKIRDESRMISELLARFAALTTFQAIESDELRTVFEEIIKPSDLPLILSDTDGRPFVWKNIGIPPEAVDVATVAGIDPENPPEGPIRRVIDMVHRFDATNPPIPMYAPDGEKLFGYVHYGERSLVRELRWVPVVQFITLFFFLALGYLGYRSMKTSEQRAIWIGLAKETAHQLGTPISSLLGWVELLREKVMDQRGDKDEPPDSVSLDGRFIHDVVEEMDRDADRLNKIALRFGQVGSVPQLRVQDVVPIVSGAVRYFRRRLPHLRKQAEIREGYGLVPPVSVNKELVEWCIENVLKNAIDATQDSGGVIEISVAHRRETECVEIRISDEGRGMSPRELKKIFSPGYSTKTRGWGLGLTLAMRIIEDYHGGKIWVEKSQIGKGTTFVISFPV
ncbi:MAG: HAMP domain-containing histidine kinase [Candidatus Eisenbacteria bacterium]|uniref:histidine kinase n=1 Tax=Eiseniibacteriota bacterium TaxID=2212470 RepID=A0A948RU04_UNCEI|nr:HAMP domain-containing histidine kinase [Candidatus Eisenbacteria bacterium]MBU2689684.1 HAMP domain-containing histidine kinase [Candidatus Eisenbacteria bacterium]